MGNAYARDVDCRFVTHSLAMDNSHARGSAIIVFTVDKRSRYNKSEVSHLKLVHGFVMFHACLHYINNAPNMSARCIGVVKTMQIAAGGVQGPSLSNRIIQMTRPWVRVSNIGRVWPLVRNTSIMDPEFTVQL